MNREELIESLEEALSDIAPGFKITIDRKGQVLIHTGLYEDEDGEISLPEEENDVDGDDPDLETDEDLLSLDDEESDDD